jgi:hypothetical protein
MQRSIPYKGIFIVPKVETVAKAQKLQYLQIGNYNAW